MKMKRVNFEANQAVVQLIESLQERTGSTMKGVVVGALQFLGWALDQRAHGRVITALETEKSAQRLTEYESELMLSAASQTVASLPSGPQAER